MLASPRVGPTSVNKISPAKPTNAYPLVPTNIEVVGGSNKMTSYHGQRVSISRRNQNSTFSIVGKSAAMVQCRITVCVSILVRLQSLYRARYNRST